jgi:hypothetical protein
MVVTLSWYLAVMMYRDSLSRDDSHGCNGIISNLLYLSPGGSPKPSVELTLEFGIILRLPHPSMLLEI